MSTEIIDGVEHRFAPNPKMQGEVWEAEYPPIESNSEWLINRYTGEIIPNLEEFRGRSDILMPYLGESPKNAPVSDTTNQINEVYEHAATLEVSDGELREL